MQLYMLTTSDNPYSPVTDYDEWYAWDMQRYNSNALLARVVRTSSELSDADRLLDIQRGIEEIVEENLSGVHIRVPSGTLESVLEEEMQFSARDSRQAA